MLISLRAIRYVLLLTGLSAAVSAAPRRRFDERGNPIEKSDKAAENKTPAAAAIPSKPSVLAPASATTMPAPSSPATPLDATGQAGGRAKGSLPSTEGTAAAAETAAAEEAAEAQKQKTPLTKVYLENAQLYLRSARIDKALEFLRKSQEAGDDAFSQEARLQSLFLRSRRGDQGLEAEAEGFDEKLKLQALLRIADGYYACAREQAVAQRGNLGGQPQRTDCMGEAERLYAFTGELAPRSVEGRLARLRLGLLLMDTGRHEAALPHLTQTLLAELASPLNAAGDIPFDRAYFRLGQLYERPWYHQDVHKARQAYKQVLKYKRSPYLAQARERIAALERFGTGYSRP